MAAQHAAIHTAADWFAGTILAGRMVHVFGSGHSRIMVEEMWPRYGSFPGFNPIVELSLSFHNLVVGANGQRQAMFLENVSGLARLMRSYALAAMENVPLWHERDISHSSVERVIAPDATIALDYMLAKLEWSGSDPETAKDGAADAVRTWWRGSAPRWDHSGLKKLEVLFLETQFATYWRTSSGWRRRMSTFSAFRFCAA